MSAAAMPPTAPTYARLRALLGRLGRFYALMLLVSALALAIFLKLAAKGLEASTRELNTQVLLAIHGHASPAGDQVALALAAIGSEAGIILVGAAFGGWLLRRGRLLDLATLGAAVTGCALLTSTLKGFYQQARPTVFPRLAEELSYSFPSGHASMSLALYGFLAGWLIAQGPREPWRWLVALAAVAFAGAIGASRLYLGVHWPTDVAGGFAIATFWLAVCAAGRGWLRTRGFFAGPVAGPADEGPIAGAPAR